MIETILREAHSDPRLKKLFEQTAEYASIYLLAKERQKGCDGLGSTTMVKQEFSEMLEELLNYCASRNIIREARPVDLDIIAKKMDSVGKYKEE